MNEKKRLQTVKFKMREIGRIFGILLLITFSKAEDAKEDLHQDIKDIKSILTSVQGSLLTSVRLLQDQMDQSKQTVTDLSTKVGKIERGMDRIGEHLGELNKRSRVWDSLQHHVAAWADLMSSVDSKMDHVSRSHTSSFESLSERLGGVQDSLNLGLKQLNQDRKQDETSNDLEDDTAMAMLRSINQKVNGIAQRKSSKATEGGGGHRRRGKDNNGLQQSSSLLHEIHASTSRIEAKVDDLLFTVDERGFSASGDSSFDDDEDLQLLQMRFKEKEENCHRRSKIEIQRMNRAIQRHLGTKLDSIKMEIQDRLETLNSQENTSSLMLNNLDSRMQRIENAVKDVNNCCSSKEFVKNSAVPSAHVDKTKELLSEEIQTKIITEFQSGTARIVSEIKKLNLTMNNDGRKKVRNEKVKRIATKSPEKKNEKDEKPLERKIGTESEIVDCEDLDKSQYPNAVETENGYVLISKDENASTEDGIPISTRLCDKNGWTVPQNREQQAFTNRASILRSGYIGFIVLVRKLIITRCHNSLWL